MIEDAAFSPANIDNAYWNGRLARWELLEAGTFLRNYGPGNTDLMDSKGGSTEVAKHTHTVGGDTERLWGAVVTSTDAAYGLFNSIVVDRPVLTASATSTAAPENPNTYPEKLVIQASKNTAFTNKYTVISFNPNNIQLNDMETEVTEQVPPFQYVYIYKRVV